MKFASKWAWVAFALYLDNVPADAQVAALGKGFFLDQVGGVTSTTAEVISGNNSIKGSYSGLDVLSYKPFLYTDPTFIRFAPNETRLTRRTQSR